MITYKRKINCDYCGELKECSKTTCEDCIKDLNTRRQKSFSKHLQVFSDDQKILEFIKAKKNVRRQDVLSALNISEGNWKVFIKRHKTNLINANGKWSVKVEVPPKEEPKEFPSFIVLPIFRDANSKIDEKKTWDCIKRKLRGMK